jgi:hypothetical protein
MMSFVKAILILVGIAIMELLFWDVWGRMFPVPSLGRHPMLITC